MNAGAGGDRLEQRLHIEAGRRQQGLRRGVRAGSNGAGASQDRPLSATMRRTSEKPLECRPEEGRPSATSPTFNPGARQQAAAFGGADGKAREIVVALRIEARHFRGFAADQGAARFDAGRRRCL